MGKATLLRDIAAKIAEKGKPFYSAAEKAAQELPRTKGTGAEFMRELEKTKGVKPAEIQHRKLDEIKSMPKMTKEEFVKEVQARPAAQVEEKVLREPTQKELEIEAEKLMRQDAENYVNETYGQRKFKDSEKWDDYFLDEFERLQRSEKEYYLDQAFERYKSGDANFGTQYNRDDLVLPGGENYREILLKLPEGGLTRKEAADKMVFESMARRGELSPEKQARLNELLQKEASLGQNYRSSHWPDDPNVVAHMRVSDRVGPNGEKVLHVEEIQSDWHQAGRKKGYDTPEKRAEQQAKLDQILSLRQSLLTRQKELEDLALPYTSQGKDAPADIVGEWSSVSNKLNELQTAQNRLGRSFGTENLVPDAPFKKNWQELAMNRLLSYAAENGYDRVALTPGLQQVKRYEDATRKAVDEVAYNPSTGYFNAIKDGKSVMAEKLSPEELPKMVGEDAAKQLMTGQPNNVGVVSLASKDLTVGGEGMKGFYDKMLPDYLNKLGKKYGVEVDTMPLTVPPKDSMAVSKYPGGEDYIMGKTTWSEFLAQNPEAARDFQSGLHSFRITPEMRKDITEQGFPLYSAIAAPVGLAGAQDAARRVGITDNEDAMKLDLMDQELREPEQNFDKGGAAFGVFPQMKGKRSKQDREAAKGMPLAAARGFVAGTMGLPSDVLNIGGILYNVATGQEVGEVPYGSDYWKDVLPLKDESAAGKAATELGGMFGGAGMGRASKAALKQAARLINDAHLYGQGPLAAITPQAMKMDVWHGSPHKFPPTAKNPLGEFDPSKIGTGEGAQAYGHGHYTAEARGVGEDYARNLANRDMANQGRLNAHANAQRLANLAGDPKYAADDVRFVLQNEPDHPQKELLQNTLAFLESGDFARPLETKGHLYKIDLSDEAIPKMLDWDKPLSEQPEVIKALKGTDYEIGLSQKEAEKIADQRLRQEAYDWADETGGDPVDYINNADWEKYVDQVRKESGSIDSSITGADLHRLVMRDEGYRPDLFDPENYQIGTSEALRQLGIPGIKYLDRSSRQAGEGTRNFVVFPGEEDLLKILARDSEQGMAAGGKPKYPTPEMREKLRQLRESLLPAANEAERQKRMQQNMEQTNRKVSFTDNPDEMRDEVHLGKGGLLKKAMQSFINPEVITPSARAATKFADEAPAATEIFIGPNAKTWNQAAADKALKMEKAGEDPAKIWQQTGTFRGADGVLRQEISDRSAKFVMPDEQKEKVTALKEKMQGLKEQIRPTPQKDLFPKALNEAKKDVRDEIGMIRSELKGRSMNPRTTGIPAPYIFEHPELYKAYPELYSLKINTEMGGDALGSLSILPSRGDFPGEMVMDISTKGLTRNPTSTTLHEMQHAVQTLERMGPGGSPRMAFADPKAYEILERMRAEALKPATIEEFNKANRYPENEVEAAYQQYLKTFPKELSRSIDRDLQSRAAMEYYKRLAGEAEARAVQDRQMMTPAERLENPPPSSYDVPQEDLIVKPPREFGAGGEVARMLKLARAPAKSKQEIEAIAQRVAPQVTGEFVRGEKGTQSVAKKTQKQFAREKELPVEFTDVKSVPKVEVINPESLKGMVVTGIPGDPTVTGKSLVSVGKTKLDSPSPQHGGPLYGLGRNDDIFWASGIDPAGRVQTVAEEAMQAYDAPVAGQYIMMGPDSINYALHFADANLSAIDPSKMTKRQIEEFNELIRFGDAKSGPRPAFPGIENKEESYLHFAFDPHLRKYFNKLMQMPKVTERFNLPSGQDIRFAITEEPLRNLETGVTGYSMGHLAPEVPKSALPLSEHPTYSHDIPGRFMGGLKYPTPYELSFPDTLKTVRENPEQASQEFNSLKYVGPRQIYDQQMIDELKMYEEAMKKLTGKKKGGKVDNGLIEVKKRKAKA